MTKRKWLWFIGLYVVSVIIVAGVTFLLQWLTTL